MQFGVIPKWDNDLILTCTGCIPPMRQESGVKKSHVQEFFFPKS